ncbi:MAG: hypothetical protein AAF334_07690 [Pseudomonadota bacterium]
MPLDRLALYIVCGLAALWGVGVLGGLIAIFPFGLPAMLALALGGYFLYRVVRDRLANAEDDYYEKHVDR